MEAGAACGRRYELPVTDLSAASVEPPELMDLDPVDRWCVLARADRGEGRQKLAQPPRAALDSRDTRSSYRASALYKLSTWSCDYSCEFRLLSPSELS